jgi:hypothetical protein
MSISEHDNTLERIAAIVRSSGFVVTHEYPGYLLIAVGDRRVAFGDSCDTWGGEIYVSEQEYTDGFAGNPDSFDTCVDTRNRNANDVAQALLVYLNSMGKRPTDEECGTNQTTGGKRC